VEAFDEFSVAIGDHDADIDAADVHFDGGRGNFLRFARPRNGRDNTQKKDKR
jgi:hypothetical protein